MAKFGLSEVEKEALRSFATSLMALLQRDAESVGRIADYVGQYGPEEDTESTDVVLMECMKIIVDAKARQK
jgi:hypothetical protein